MTSASSRAVSRMKGKLAPPAITSMGAVRATAHSTGNEPSWLALTSKYQKAIRLSPRVLRREYPAHIS